MLQPTELLIRLRQAEERAHITANLQQILGTGPSVQHPPMRRGAHPCSFSKDLPISCQKKEHSMRIKEDPSTTLSTGERMDTMHKHCCRQFNSQGRMWIILDMIQAGYKGQIYGNVCILQISSREWSYGETQPTLHNRADWNREHAFDDIETWE